MKEYDSAIGAFEKGIEFAMTRSKSNSSIIAYNSILVNFGSVLRAARMPLEAQQHLLQGIEWLKGAGTEPSPALYNNLGLVEQDMGNLDSAERYFTIAVENNRRDRESSQESAYMMRVGEKGGDVDAVEEILKSNLQKIKQRKSDNNLLG
jgi:tetratricopeptide (TPR) repeat protein